MNMSEKISSSASVLALTLENASKTAHKNAAVIVHVYLHVARIVIPVRIGTQVGFRKYGCPSPKAHPICRLGYVRILLFTQWQVPEFPQAATSLRPSIWAPLKEPDALPISTPVPVYRA